MKRQTQTTGVRYWYGGDFLSIQEEAFKILDGFFGQFGPHVLMGCQVTPNGDRHDVAPGIVVIEGLDAEGRTAKMIVPFAGANNIALPIYLTISRDTESLIYKDGGVKPVVHNYKAKASTVKPTGSYVAITANSTPCFVDVIQDARHRFITDAERTAWTDKANQADVAGVFKYDYIVDSAAKLAALNNNETAIHVLIKHGVWSVNTQIGIHANCKTITGEPGSKIEINHPAGEGTLAAPISALYLIDRNSSLKITNVTAEIKVSSTQKYFAVFNGFPAMEHCVAINNPTITETSIVRSSGFINCLNLIDCQAQCTAIWASGATIPLIKGFSSCENLNGCLAVVSGATYPENESYISLDGFDHCKFLTNSEANVENTQYKGHLNGFSYCDHLNNCRGRALGAGTGSGVRLAFEKCNYLTNCLGESSGNANSSTTGVPFRYCNNITQCHSIANCNSNPGFSQCCYMSYNTSTKGFLECYSGQPANSIYAVANTLNGGWNRTVAE